MENIDEPRDIECEDEEAIRITRWKVGPKTELSWIGWPRYKPKDWPDGLMEQMKK